MSVTDFEMMAKQADQNTTADTGRTGSIATVIDPNTAVIADGALEFFEVLEALQR